MGSSVVASLEQVIAQKWPEPAPRQQHQLKPLATIRPASVGETSE